MADGPGKTFSVCRSGFSTFSGGAIMAESITFTDEMPGPEHIRTDILDTFAYQGKPQFITYTTHEFSAVCPFSGLPDLATIRICYVPSNKCLELKSLKMYFISYRPVGMYQEHVTNRIHSDLWEVLNPVYLSVETKYAVRGGIDAVCVIREGALPETLAGAAGDNETDQPHST